LFRPFGAKAEFFETFTVGSRPRLQNFAAARLAVYNGDMPRTFSLGRLMLGVTLICVVGAVLTDFPINAIILCHLCALFLPTLLLWCALSRVFTNRGTLACSCFAGAWPGFFAARPLVLEIDATYDSWVKMPVALVVSGLAGATSAALVSSVVLLAQAYWARNRARPL
jgi:hypothetical protein